MTEKCKMLKTSLWRITSSSLYTSELPRMSSEQLLSETNRSSPQQQAWGLVWQPPSVGLPSFFSRPTPSPCPRWESGSTLPHISPVPEKHNFRCFQSGESRAGTEKRTKSYLSLYPHFIRNASAHICPLCLLFLVQALCDIVTEVKIESSSP